jgi:hypothetical protein
MNFTDWVKEYAMWIWVWAAIVGFIIWMLP